MSGCLFARLRASDMVVVRVSYVTVMSGSRFEDARFLMSVETVQSFSEKYVYIFLHSDTGFPGRFTYFEIRKN